VGPGGGVYEEGMTHISVAGSTRCEGHAPTEKTRLEVPHQFERVDCFFGRPPRRVNAATSSRSPCRAQIP
jgi:hypothetical protein